LNKRALMLSAAAAVAMITPTFAAAPVDSVATTAQKTSALPNPLTITSSGGKEMTFTVDGSTKFVGKGLGTKARTGKLTAPDAVSMNDNVSVTYHDMGGTLHAATVRVVTAAKK